eukprot:CAMPEP_0206009524 /NCGR_PEP_ID=MMETSP1464-20131121/9836_1 /ASSEMBLY_ACC=CAM_ASM_001124 /TAXON_ID=119497 /ORGANISM="Exanthemachrysis gayraliae, Strain RCC1523" /LENGTH=209 /DNA_ID=CAMNT_0053383121 /DNA_START=1 /DNA_END=630 /DNA_ORIENTATION=-
MTSAVHAVATRVVAASGQLLAGATHQVAFQAVSLLSCTAIPLSLAVQGLLSPWQGREDGEGRERVREVVGAVLAMSAALGALAALGARLAVVDCVSALTADVDVAARLRSVWPVLAGATFAWCQTTALFGVFVGLGLLAPFVRVHATAAIGALAYHAAAGARLSDPLLRAWLGSLGYSALRLVLYSPTVGALMYGRRAPKGETANDGAA